MVVSVCWGVWSLCEEANAMRKGWGKPLLLLPHHHTKKECLRLCPMPHVQCNRTSLHPSMSSILSILS